MRNINQLTDGDLVFALAVTYTKRMKNTTVEKQIFLTGVNYAIQQLKKKGYNL